MNHLVFKPVLRILALRRSKTKGDQKRIQELEQKLKQLVETYDGKMAEATLKAQAIKEEIRKEGENQSRKIVHEAKQFSLEEIDRMKKELEFKKKDQEKQLEVQAKQLGLDLAEKILGRTLN